MNSVERVHLNHCNQGEHIGTCKYGETDTCPAMKDKQSRNSYRAAYRDVKRAASELLQLLKSFNADEVEGVVINDMRDEVETITKRFHEFSAYRSAHDYGQSNTK